MDEVMKLTHDLGGEAERTVSEIYSPPRLTDVARRKPRLGIVPGFALDLTTCNEEGVAWDFDIAERRQAARELVRAQKPMLLIGSTMCTRFCSFQWINDAKRPSEVVRREHVRAMLHLRFVCELYREQMNGGDISSMNIRKEQRRGARAASRRSTRCLAWSK